MDEEGLIPVANTEVDTKADVVFIHGLGGTSHGTWEGDDDGKPFFWPAELGRALPSVAVWTVGYPAGVTEFGNPGTNIELRAGNIAEKLALAGLGKRPLIFVTHSMGGLIVKYLLVGSATMADVDRKELAGATAGVVFCAVPHRGSGFASAAGLLGNLRQDHVAEMERNSVGLDLLHEKFVEWQRTTKTPILSYAESQTLYQRKMLGRLVPIGVIVPRASANPNIAGHSVKDIDEDHLSIVKPRRATDDVPLRTLRFVEEVLASPAESLLAGEDRASDLLDLRSIAFDLACDLREYRFVSGRPESMADASAIDGMSDALWQRVLGHLSQLKIPALGGDGAQPADWERLESYVDQLVARHSNEDLIKFYGAGALTMELVLGGIQARAHDQLSDPGWQTPLRKLDGFWRELVAGDSAAINEFWRLLGDPNSQPPEEWGQSLLALPGKLSMEIRSD